MKVLHINSYYISSFFYSNLYDEHIRQGLDVVVYVPAPNRTEISSIQLGSYTQISLNHRKNDRAIFQLKHKKILNDILKCYRSKEFDTFDVIHAHSLFSNGYIAYKLKQIYGVPYIVAVRNTDVNVFFRYMLHLRKLGLRILEQASKVIFISPTYRDIVIDSYIPIKMRHDFLKKSIVVPNGIDSFWFQNKVENKERNNNNLIRIITVALICRNKNQIVVCRAIEELQKRGINVEYTVIGKVKNERLLHKITSYPFVNYISFMPKEELIKQYRVSDIFVMPSKTETFGLTYAEAMTQGLPVIYSKGQGFDCQFKEGEVGYHVKWDNPKEIADAIEKILLNYKQISINCNKLSDGFDWTTIASEYKKIYEGD